MNRGEVMEEHQWDTCLHADSVSATDQELVAGVLVVLLYVQGLDLSVGDAGTVLVNGGRSTGETCLPGQGGVRRKDRELWSGG